MEDNLKRLGDLRAHEADLDAHTFDIFSLKKVGQYYCSDYLTKRAGSNFQIVADRIYSIVLPMARPITIDELAVYIDTAGAVGSKIRMAIYDVDLSTLFPGNLLVETGEMAADAQAWVTDSLSLSISKGLYYIACISNGNPKLQYTDNGYGILGSAEARAYQNPAGWYKDQAYGAFPSPFPAGPTMLNTPLLLAYRLASLD